MIESDKLMQDQWKNSYLFSYNTTFIEELYERYLNNPNAVDPQWQQYFSNMNDGQATYVSPDFMQYKFQQLTKNNFSSVNSGPINDLQTKVWKLIAAYRTFGMAYSNLDPIHYRPNIKSPELDIGTHGLDQALDESFFVDLDIDTSPKLPLHEIIKRYDNIYCSTVGFEFEHISDLPERNWLTQYVENNYLNFTLTPAEQIDCLSKLTEAEGLERYIHTQYVGQKRFSLEGGEAFIPALNRLIEKSAQHGVKQVCIGMAHRGRLNSLVNIAGKPPHKIFAEFDDVNYPHADFVTTGDVKYHKGYKCNYQTPFGAVKVMIAYNPSHLEVVNPVVSGIVRAYQDNLTTPQEVLGILVHGDAALIGLGTNQGILNMSRTRGYNIHGTIHIVINNQIGFTTSNIQDIRSSRYCTDIVKMIEAPILHVNGDDLDSIMFVIDFAINYRMKYNKDIIINLVCFRRYGHNEADEPSMTQPYMYKMIKQHPGIRKKYAAQLINASVTTQAQVDQMQENYRLSLATGVHPRADMMQALDWYNYIDITSIINAKVNVPVATAITNDVLATITHAVTTLPNPDFTLHATLVKLIETRKAMGSGNQPIDFGMAEMLAYGSLLLQGVSVRMSGEDTKRGTFSHRHAVWHDMNCDVAEDISYSPLSTLTKNSQFHLFDSVLNEECVLGFEYGYGSINLRSLVIWEAQFGDFANGAQVIIDQFISSGEMKWGVLANVTLMLPHGYDGQGPEHTSARMERYLQLCAENNLQIVVPSTAAQMFHLLRHQALTNFIKPLVIFMSKNLLRNKDAASNLDAFTQDTFKLVIPDAMTSTVKCTKVLICCGQIYYALSKQRSELKLENSIALVRIEQLYPFPDQQLSQELSRYKQVTQFIWIQDEPYNQGAWMYLREHLDGVIKHTKKHFSVISRSASAAPACGRKSVSDTQLQELLAAAFIK